MEENPQQLYIACEACKSNFVVPIFWFLFWKFWENWIHLFLRKRFPRFSDLNRKNTFRTIIHCVHRGYPKISNLSEIILLCWLCKNISYNFTRMSMFYLKHLYNKTFDVSIMDRDWLIFFQKLSITWQFIILHKSQISFI